MGLIAYLDWKLMVDACAIYLSDFPHEVAYLDLLVDGEIPPPNGFGEASCGDGILGVALHLAGLSHDAEVPLARNGKGIWVTRSPIGVNEIVEGEFALLCGVMPILATLDKARERVNRCIIEIKDPNKR